MSEKNFWEGKEVLVTGGTGSLGKTIVKLLLKNYRTKGIRIYSRDEAKQYAFNNELLKNIDITGMRGNVAFLIGDVRDQDRLNRAMNRVDIVIHTAAMKQVPACEYNPMEAIETNISGAKNVINVAIDNNVSKVMNIATDKGVYPINLYGCTKAVAEKLFIFSNIYSPGRTMFSCCRYGNVIGSRGSVVPFFKQLALENKALPITDIKMTRFWITLNQVAQFVLDRVEEMSGGEIFVPVIKSMSVLRLAKIIAPEAEIQDVGIREGEKLHECLISQEEMLRSEWAFNNKQSISAYYTIKRYSDLDNKHRKFFRQYSSDICLEYTKEEMKKMLEE